MSDEPKRRKRHWWSWVVVVLLVLYPVSIGPALALHANGYIPYRVYDAAYRPMFWLMNQSNVLDDSILWYMRLWHQPDEDTHPAV